MISNCDKNLNFGNAMIRAIHTALNSPEGSGLICFNPDTKLRCLVDGIASVVFDLIVKYEKHPCPVIYFNNGFILHFRNGRSHGQALRGLNLKTFVLVDKEMLDKSEVLTAETLRTIKKGCDYGLFSSSFAGEPELYFDLGVFYAKTVIENVKREV